MPARGRFGGKKWIVAATLVFLRTSFSTNKMQSTANLADAFLCFLLLSDSSYVRAAFRNRSAAALRDLRDRHGQDRKASPNRIAPARLRLQVRRLQPDHVGRAGTAGSNAPSPPSADAAAAALIRIKRNFLRLGRVLPGHTACKASAQTSHQEEAGACPGTSLANCAMRS